MSMAMRAPKSDPRETRRIIEMHAGEDESQKNRMSIAMRAGSRDESDAMKEANKGKEPPVFMNTHPSSKQRIENINGWIDKIRYEYPPI